MANKVASVLVAIAILAAAFLLIPDPTVPAPTAPATDAVAEEAPVIGAPAVANPSPNPDPPVLGADRDQPPPDPVTNNGGQEAAATCQQVVDRLTEVGSKEFSQAVGDALYAKMTVEEVKALCKRLDGLDNAAMLAEIKALTTLTP
jgi:hypothetical protein